MIKLLHTADIHLGARFIGMGDKGAIQREQVRTTFKNVVELAIEEGVDVFLVSGDLFESNQQSRANIDLVIEQFGQLAAKDIPICLIPGTHDCFDSTSIYRKVSFQQACPNLTLLTAEGWSYKEFANIDLTVYGKPNISNRSSKSPLGGLKRMTESRYQVAMAHGSLNIGTVAEDDHVFTSQEIQDSQMDYIALGHWHDVYKCSDKGVIAWYSGAPELIARDQKQPGNVLLVTLTDSSKVSVEQRQTGQRFRDEVAIDAADIESLQQLKASIVEGAQPNLVRRVILRGLRGEDLYILPEELEKELADNFFDLRIKDESHLKVEQLSGAQFEDRLILSKFVSLMKEHIEACQDEDREIAEEALQYGVALLQGKEIL